MKFQTEDRSSDPPPGGVVLDLLAYAASDPSALADGSQLRLLRHVDDAEFRHAIGAGMGPLLYQAVRNHLDQLPPARRDVLLSAELTAQVRHGNLVETAKEVIDACCGLQIPVTLLKGISISHQHYPAAHLRPMGDIDILVPEARQREIECELIGRGYVPQSDHQLDGDSYHGIPLLHSQRRVWVEVHRALFPDTDRLRHNGLFSPPHIARHSVASSFHGKPVHRLSDELQLIYLACAWVRDLSLQGIHPSFAVPLLDAVYLLKASRQSFDWEGLASALRNETAIASSYLMLAYLCRHNLAECPILPGLGHRQETVGRLELKIIHGMVDDHLVGGRPFTRLFDSARVWETLLRPGSHAAKLVRLPWNILFPPRAQERFTLDYQLDRFGRLLRRLWVAVLSSGALMEFFE